MLKRTYKLLVLLMAVVGVMLALTPATALAATVLYEGTAGNTYWTLDDEGLLQIAPVEETDGVLAADYVTESGTYFSWYPYANDVVSASVEDGVSATSLTGLFYGCGNLAEADLTGLDTTYVTDMSYAFYGCDSLRTVYVGDTWSIADVAASDGMFEGCTYIAGGLGTTYDSTYADATYAHVDAEGDPGYFVAEGETPVHLPGWANENGAYYYYELNGSMRKSAWVSTDDAWYYVGSTGKSVENGWVKTGGKWYYFGADRTSVTDDWVYYKKKWYYCGSDSAALYNSWLNYNDSWYYFSNKGTPVAKGWVKSGGQYYYFGSKGTLVTDSWVKYSGKWYYLDSDGHPLANQRVYSNGKYYFFDAYGYCVASRTSSYARSLSAVINAAKRTPTTGAGGCASWVTNVFKRAGIGTWNGSARDMYYKWCTSSSQSALMPGMIIAVPSTAGTAAAVAYGHVGIYLGNGIVMHNLKGVVGTMSLKSWISMLGVYATPRWGWFGGVVLY